MATNAAQALGLEPLWTTESLNANLDVLGSFPRPPAAVRLVAHAVCVVLDLSAGPGPEGEEE